MALVIAAVMVMGMSVSALAGTIDVQNVVNGETYTAYKILNYTNSGSAYSYYLTKAQYDAIGTILASAGLQFTASADGTQYYVGNTEGLGGSGVSEVAGHLKESEDGLKNALRALEGDDVLGIYEAIGANGSAAFTDLGAGYYFITSTTGSIAALHDEDSIATVVEKNTVPSVDKKQSGTEGDYGDAILHKNVGDIVYYQLEVTDGTGTDADITLSDVMTAGLTYNAGTIKINGSGVADDADTDGWKVTVSGQNITVLFKAAYVATVGAGEKITVTYNATINEKAIVDSADRNKNEVTLTYSQQTQKDQVYVETYDISLRKTDGTNALAGAKFKLFEAETGGTALTFLTDDTGYYLSGGDNANAEIDAGAGTGVSIRGLKPGTYYFEETEAPNGYNKLDERKPVTITAGATTAAEIIVINNAGTELPSTGGIGTTIFYVVGGILVLGAGVLLVTKRRVRIG